MNDIRQLAQYAPEGIEEKWARAWEQEGLFAPAEGAAGEPFVITLPPPNVTGVLHMGHCLSNAIQDVLIRWMRMRGRPTLWIPGTDHASIATEQVVSKMLRAEGLDKHAMGREAFLERAWAWKHQTHGVITSQLRRLGCSLDWPREAFTMDEPRSRAVAHAFVTLREQGLIVRDLYLVNWCPHCLTAISDDEVDHREVQGSMWRLRYPLADGQGHVTVATTRPETMFGDTAVAVHPDDPERRHLIGRRVKLPLTGREIPIIGDHHADPEKGTGFVKITPAHDPNDFEVGRRHDLPQVVCMDERGVMNEAAGAFAGLDRFAARKAVLAALQEQDLYDGEAKNVHQVGHHDRCGNIIEPYLSRQWFLRMEPLSAAAVRAVEDGTITLLPERWVGVYHNWLRNIRDWCISRQLWWGHRIPVWTCGGCGREICQADAPAACPGCGSAALVQDPDVLDTWFSSWLWTFSPLGWPDDTPDLRAYHPTSVLVTGPDIIFFWVARMIMASYHFLGEPPFREVLFHGLVRDADGRKMSKSLGNSPDPIELMDKYGADALRMSMVMLTPTGQDVFFGEETLEVGRNFCNKVFQASKLVLGAWDEAGLDAGSGGNAPDVAATCDLGVMADHADDPAAAAAALWGQVFGAPPAFAFRASHLELADLWIMNRLAAVAAEVDGNLEKRRLNDAAYTAYNFFRHELCDWYLEAVKPRLRDEERRREAAALAVVALGASYKLLHPVMPFITEELWSWLPPARGRLMVSPFPVCDGARLPWAAPAARFAQVVETVGVIRSLRTDLDVPPGRRGTAVLRAADPARRAELARDADLIALLAKLETVEVVEGGPDPHPAGAGVAGAVEVFLLMKGLVDLDRERSRLGKELDKALSFVEANRRKLTNESFVARAPAEVVARQQEMLAESEARAEALRRRLDALGE
ncbi:MAG: valine--tRNA ligase [bacterium]|nr:valine--tRNA ligase [bacterium]